jgi:hypothetical protein
MRVNAPTKAVENPVLVLIFLDGSARGVKPCGTGVTAIWIESIIRSSRKM